MEIIFLKESLREPRLVLVLPDREPDTPEKAHLLHPRLEIGKRPAAQKPVRPTIKRLLADPSAKLKKGRPVRPQDVIPFEKDGFKDF